MYFWANAEDANVAADRATQSPPGQSTAPDALRPKARTATGGLPGPRPRDTRHVLPLASPTRAAEPWAGTREEAASSPMRVVGLIVDEPPPRPSRSLVPHQSQSNWVSSRCFSLPVKDETAVECCCHGYSREDRKHELLMAVVLGVETDYGFTETDGNGN